MSDDQLADVGLTREQLTAARADTTSYSWDPRNGMPAVVQKQALLRAADGITPRFGDSIIWFFQQCFHLGDWIYTCPVSGISKQVVNDYIKATDLGICADFANGTKHLLLTRKTFTTESQAGHGGAMSGDGKTLKVDKWTIGEANHDVFGLAERCMALWREFLAANAPSVPETGIPVKMVTWQQGEPWPPPGWGAKRDDDSQ